jgi:hypothetical protein
VSVGSYRGIAASPAAKAELIAGIARALVQDHGYAAGKVGNSEQAILQYPVLLEHECDPLRLNAFELVLSHKSLRHSGIFPASTEFLRIFSDAYANAFRRLDCVGLISDAWPQNEEVLRYHRYSGLTIHFRDQEPDRSVPSNEAQCYLPLCRGRRVLIVSPFAELLQERATRETFEAVWRKTGKPWFAPASVEALQIPYGWSPATWTRFPTALDLLVDIRRQLDAASFDVALIGAGLLGSMIAVAVKERGKVGLSLGGHLQIVFGVNGSRWRERVNWQRNYFNDTWIDVPEQYRPPAEESDENYW